MVSEKKTFEARVAAGPAASEYVGKSIRDEVGHEVGHVLAAEAVDGGVSIVGEVIEDVLQRSTGEPSGVSVSCSMGFVVRQDPKREQTESAAWKGALLTRTEWEAATAKAPIGSTERTTLLRDEPHEYRCDLCQALLGIRVGENVRWAPGSTGHHCKTRLGHAPKAGKSEDMSREIWGEFADDPLLPRAVALWQSYDERCEAYDRTVCTGSIGPNGIHPATSEEQGLISRHAREQRAATLRAAAEEGIPDETMRRARGIAVRPKKASVL